MTRSPFDSLDSPRAARPPLCLHPAFPVIVAAWLAVLLGAGSLILPGVLLERGVEAIGVEALLVPPLGPTARGLIALVSSVAGALAGITIAGIVGRAHLDEDRSQGTRSRSGARRPISVNEELGVERLVNGVAWPIDQRRAMALAEDDQAGDWLDQSPVSEGVMDAGTPDIDDHPSTETFSDGETTQLGAVAAAQLAQPEATRDEAPEPTEPDPEPLYFSPPSLARRARAESGARQRDRAASPHAEDSLEPSRDDAAWGAPKVVRALPQAPPAEGAAQGMVANARRPKAGALTKVPEIPTPAEAARSIAMIPSCRDRATVASGPFNRPSTQAETDAALREALATLRQANGRS